MAHPITLPCCRPHHQVWPADIFIFSLIVSEPLTIKNFSSGQFWLQLVGEAAYAPVTRDTFLTTVPDPNNSPSATIQVDFFDEGNNRSNNMEDPLTDDTNNFIHALGGADTMISVAGDDQLYMDCSVRLALT